MSDTEQDFFDLKHNLARDLDRYFDDLVQAFQQPLFAFAYRTTGCSQDAEEVVQDTFIRAYRGLASYERDRVRALALRAWLYRICLNLLRNRLRRHKIVTEELRPDGNHSSEDAGVDPVTEAYERRENVRELERSLSMLPARYRSAIVLRYVAQLTYPEIALATNQREGTVKSNVHRGLAMLRSDLKANGGRTQ